MTVQADKAFEEAIQMRSLGWSPDSKGPHPHEKRLWDTARPRGTTTGAEAEGRALGGPLDLRLQLLMHVCGFCRADRSRWRLWAGQSTVEGATLRRSSLTKPGQLAAPPASPGRGGQGEGSGAGKNKANDTAGVEGEIGHRVFYSLTGKINSNWALSKHPLVA